MNDQRKTLPQAWPIIDGPLEGKTWAHDGDHFYAAELVIPEASRPRPGSDSQASQGRTEYRLQPGQSGSFVWSSKTE